MGRNQIEICFGRMNSKGGGRTEYGQCFIPGWRRVHRLEKTRSTHHGKDTRREGMRLDKSVFNEGAIWTGSQGVKAVSLERVLE